MIGFSVNRFKRLAFSYQKPFREANQTLIPQNNGQMFVLVKKIKKSTNVSNKKNDPTQPKQN